MKKIIFHKDGKNASVMVGENQFKRLKKQWYKNLDHCEVANESLEEFIGCVLQNYAKYEEKHESEEKSSINGIRFIRKAC